MVLYLTVSKPGGGTRASGRLAHSLIDPAFFTSPIAEERLDRFEEHSSSLSGFV